MNSDGIPPRLLSSQGEFPVVTEEVEDPVTFLSEGVDYLVLQILHVLCSEVGSATGSDHCRHVHKAS